MDTARIAELLQTFTQPGAVSPSVLKQLQRYLDLLLRWNARMNLTAVREPEQIVVRHFGESLFAARVLLEGSSSTPATLADLGSGAGFPGIPIKLYAPEIDLTLIESQPKKATFLRETVRTLNLDRAAVFCGRAEQWGKTAEVVTLRAVERFEEVLPVAAGLVAPGGKLCLLVGSAQLPTAHQALGSGWKWSAPENVPQSMARVVVSGQRA
ncbi:MAG: 16S rRNA (guanine(527)-N(7))-methyltransferase RsmG [Acidobacteriota bacterium]|nr:16S rRNA (guanine(527)-N(7))-methyltransferase RsmG [Acidobacteriota bacterium]